MTYIITDQDVARAMEVLGPPTAQQQHSWRSVSAKRAGRHVGLA